MNKLKLRLTNIYATILPFLGGLLGALGGADNSSKTFRRIILPILIMGLAFLKTESILTLTIMLMIFPLSKGYGIPGEGDAGSSLGRFWYNVFNQNHLLADIFTRGTIGLLICITLLSIPIIKKNWLIYGLCCIFIISVNCLISWRNLGTYTLFGKMLTWSETITWGTITLSAVLMIQL